MTAIFYDERLVDVETDTENELLCESPHQAWPALPALLFPIALATDIIFTLDKYQLSQQAWARSCANLGSCRVGVSFFAVMRIVNALASGLPSFLGVKSDPCNTNWWEYIGAYAAALGTFILSYVAFASAASVADAGYVEHKDIDPNTQLLNDSEGCCCWGLFKSVFSKSHESGDEFSQTKDNAPKRRKA